MSEKEILNPKDPKGSLKNLIAYLKHLWKDPVEGIEDAKKRGKEASFAVKWGLVIAIVGVVGSTALGMIPAIGKILAIIPGLLMVIGLLMWVFGILIKGRVSVAIKRFEKLECPNCKTLIEYGENVNYVVTDKWEKKTKQTKDGRTTITQTEFTEVKISCKCQNCGTEKDFTKLFATKEFVNGSKKYSYEVADRVVDFFTSRNI